MEANYGILALIPPVVAIGLCFATKQVLISMFAGLFAGALVISNWNPFAAVSYSLDALATNMADNVVLLLFTLFMGVGIAFIWRLGGSYALAEAAKRRFKKRRSVCLGTWGLGMVCSVNDCLVAAVDGNVFRDICKDYRISSEKFSYVLDSTAAPAAAFFISDWIAYQISMIGQGLDMAGITGITPVSAYINGLPFNMYSIFTLIFVGMMMYTGRDYGPMLKAEAYVKAEAHKIGAVNVKQIKDKVLIYFKTDANVSGEKLMKLISESRGRILFTSTGGEPYLTYKLKDEKHILDEIKTLIKEISA